MQREDLQNLSFSQENILANSIRIARERLGKAGDESGVERDGHGDGHNQTFSFSRNKSSSMKQSSAAQAIKVLHQRIAELQAFNATLTKQTSQAKRELNLKSLQCQSLQSQHTQTLQKLTSLKQKLSKSEKAQKQKELELDELKLFIKEKQSYYKEKLSQSQGKAEEERKLKEGLESKVRDLNKRIDNNQKVIVQMIRELEEEKNKNAGTGEINFGSPHVTGNNNEKFHKYSKSSKSKEYDNFPVIVDEPEGEADQRLKSRNNYRQRVASGKKVKANPQPEPSQPKRKPKNPKSSQKPLETLTKQLQQKNKQLYSMLRTADRKNAESQKQKNEYKDKFYALKNTVDSILEEINRLPNGLAHKFKCCTFVGYQGIVKVRKIESQNLEGLRSFGELGRRGRDGRRFRSKSSRNTSKESSAGSKNKERQLKMQDLNLSDHNMSQTRSHSKSNRRSLTNYLKSATKHPKAESETETQPIKALTKKIREQRKELCEMYKKVKEETDPERELTLKSEFQAKMAVNVELQGELDQLRRGRG